MDWLDGRRVKCSCRPVGDGTKLQQFRCDYFHSFRGRGCRMFAGRESVPIYSVGLTTRHSSLAVSGSIKSSVQQSRKNTSGSLRCSILADSSAAIPPIASVFVQCGKSAVWAMYGRRPRCKRNLTIREWVGCSHVFGLLSLGGFPRLRCSRCGCWP